MSGRIVLVTGGTRGIGQACAARFVANGDKVAVTFNATPPTDDGVLPLPCDVTDPEQVEAMFERLETELGPAEVVVANAGITRDQLLLRMDDAAFTSVLDANLVGAFRVARRAVKPMVRARSGRLVFISSVAALAGSAGQVNYAASKAGLIGMARSIARELASRSITANVVAPGPVATAMTAALSEERRRDLAAAIPTGRFATPDEVAAAVAFLASPEAASITGAVIPVDGGLGMGH